jgi:hypothetical protein
VTGGTSTSCQNFSFFLTSVAAMQRTSGSADGFGGDLRYGQADGLAGADKICQDIATYALPCAGSKTWRAFLCTSTVDAITRIGSGPWYDRNELLVWNSISEMSADRPPASYVYRDDLPNEDGIPNGDANLDGRREDNHQVLTACTKEGQRISTDSQAQRCNDWTSTTVTGNGGSPATTGGVAGPMTGHSWPRTGSGTHWINALRTKGCGACVNQATAVGSGSCGMIAGYGGIYCFATTP